ncbi:hypothetical protein BH11PLA2_BH11PLA2_46140 [soil metagenome]
MTASTPAASELLTWIAAGGSRPWFPASNSVTREAVDRPLNDLWKAGLIEAVDWVKGQGQGFALTAEGQKIAADPGLLSKVLAGQPLEKVLPTEVTPSVRKRTVGPTTYDRGEAARQALYTPPPLFVMPMFVVANVAMFLVGLFLAWKSGPGRIPYLKGEDAIDLLRLGGLTADTLLRGEGWRLAASPFLHSGIVHLLINMYTLVVIGSLAEDFWGRWKFIVIYVGSALAAGCLGIALRPDAILVGASGATSGLTLSVAVWMFLHRQHFDRQLVRSFARQMGLLLFLNVVLTFMVPRVCWEAHLGGAVAGILLSLSLYFIGPKSKLRSAVGVMATLVLLVAPLPLLILTVTQSAAWHQILERETFRQRYQFAHEHTAAFQGIQPGIVAALIDHANKQMAKTLVSPKLAEEARTLAATAEESANAFRTASPAGLLSRKMPDKATRYAESVKAVAEALAAVLSGASDDVAAIETAKRHMEECWQELHANPWK